MCPLSLFPFWREIQSLKCRFNNVVVINGSNPDYINTKMEDHSWYVGNMDRDSANAELEDFPQVGALNDRLRDYSQESCQVFLDELSENLMMILH